MSVNDLTLLLTACQVSPKVIAIFCDNEASSATVPVIVATYFDLAISSENAVLRIGGYPNTA